MKLTNKTVLLVIVIFFFMGMFFIDFKKEGVSVKMETEAKLTLEKKDELKKKFTKILGELFIQAPTNFEIKDVSEENGLYKLDLVIDEVNSAFIYITKDEKKIIDTVIDIEEVYKIKAETEAESEKENETITKSDKLRVELFTMSYCPYGTQFEKGYLPVIEKLGDHVDSEIKFVNYLMHGKEELDENVRQYCIGKNNPEKINSYLSCFLEDGSSAECLERNKINMEQLDGCIAKADTEFSLSKDLGNKEEWLSGKFPKFRIDDELNKKYEIQGSPTLVVNGSIVQPEGRDPNSILKSICLGFANAPKECLENISDKVPTPGFGYGELSGTQITASCGV
ncbi:MAG: hypothetical protein KAI16_00485 [Candidatus Pacebacteria bacterium]|nr:hypothetical protein [Candidatus Paceibacterota bacterium]